MGIDALTLAFMKKIAKNAVDNSESGGGTSDYSDLENKPTINGVTLEGNKTLDDIGAQSKGNYLTSESDPTVPSWAKNPVKPTYTADEVGADVSGTAESKVSEHNAAGDAHNDIRLLVQGLITRLNTLADSDDETLDQMSEIVAYIKSNKSLIDGITTGKVNVADIIDNLTTNVSNKPLSAAQGVILKELIDAITVPEKLPNPQKLIFTGAVTAEYDGSSQQTINIPSGGGTGGGITVSYDQERQAIVFENSAGGITESVTQEQVSALDNMFKIITYTTNPTSQYQTFCEAFGIEPTIPEGKYTVTNNLTHVLNSNSNASVRDGESYNAILTPDEGYEINSVIIEMGLSDITASVYSDGNISIESVTGNIVITAIAIQSSMTAQLPQDGLMGYFDLRNKSYTAGSEGLYYINSDLGNGMLYSWSNQSSKQGDDIGIKGATGNYTSERATGYPVTDNFPSTRTVCLFGKGGPSVVNSIGVDGTITNSFLYHIKYISTDKSTKNLPNEQIQYPEGFSKSGYNASFVIVNQNILKVYFNDTLHKTVDGNEIEDFESWDITPLALTSFSNYGTAYAIYNKELSEVEIVEALEFFKTLEVIE